jgi:hypothetical protein
MRPNAAEPVNGSSMNSTISALTQVCAIPQDIRWSSAHHAGATPDKPHVPVLWPLRCPAGRSAASVDAIRSTRQIETKAPGPRLIIGRGAADDKGQLMTFVEACRAWKRCPARSAGADHHPVRGRGRIRLSVPAIPFLKPMRTNLKADMRSGLRHGHVGRNTPAISVMLRGLVWANRSIQAASRDLHSGLLRRVRRPTHHILSKMMADLHDETGRITLEGFYDGVPETPARGARAWASLGFDRRERSSAKSA